MVYRGGEKPEKLPTEREVHSMTEKFEALVRASKELRRENEILKAAKRRLEDEVRRQHEQIRRYERAGAALNAGGAIQVQLTQLRNAFQGAKEQIEHLEHTRDVAIGLVRASLAGADPAEVGRLIEQIRETGRAHGIDTKALPAPESK